MCGIFGSVFDRTPLDVDAAIERLRHRGPDAQGVYRAPGVILGHTRLAILDLSPAASQPMTSADGRVTVVFNGEIYNHHELRAELAARGRTFRSRSDTEVILEGYREHGGAFLERLDGMFAIGLFDLDRRKLFLARARTGKKPVFYAHRDGGLRFASEMRALFAAGTAADMNVDALPMLLSLGYVPPPETLYKGIAQLPPASILEMEEGREPSVRRYWSAPFDAPPLEIDLEDAQREVRRLVERAVARRLEADVPLGAFLSGGIDSTIVVGVMARASSQRVKTFSIGFAGDARFDETHFARIAARAFDTEHTEFTLEPSAFDLLDRLVEAHDGPFGDSSAIPTSVVSMLTRRQVTVALSGDGGDELFAGYARFLAAETAERVPKGLRRVAGVVGKNLPGRSRVVSRVRRLLGTASLPLAERMLRWQSYFVDDLDLLLRSELRSRVATDAATRWSHAAMRSGARSPLTQALQYNFDSYLPYDLLPKVDRAAMLHSLEVRSPFLDTELIELAARLPDACRRRGMKTKWVLRRAFADLLPPEIQRRGKMGFGMPLGTWFRGHLRPFVRDTLGPRARLRELLNMNRVEWVLDTHERGERDFEHRIWLLLTLERWLQLLPSWSRQRGAVPQAVIDNPS